MILRRRTAWAALLQQISRLPRKNPYYDGPVSDHFDGMRFYNPGGRQPNGLADFLRWQFGGARARWPEAVPLAHGPTRPEARIGGGRLVVTMVGHATLLVQVAGLNLLTDPVWSDRASPLRRIGPRRVTAPGIAFDDLPPIDAILLSHNHYDHLDLDTLARLVAAHDPLIVTPLGNDRIVGARIPAARIACGDWGDRVSLGPDRSVTFTPCHHWSARGTQDRSMALWAGMVVQTPDGAMGYIGDTGFDFARPHEALAAHAPLRLAILPIGAYEPRWFMADQHQDPAEAVTGFVHSGAAFGIGHHWGTFQLTDEPREAPLHLLHAALAGHGIDADRFRALHPGETWEIPAA